MNILSTLGSLLLHILKGFGKFILIIIILIIVLLIIMSMIPTVPSKYTSKTSTGGSIEEKYLGYGSYETEKVTFDAEGDLKKFTVYYPAALESSDRQWPAVIMVNGTGVAASKYLPVLEHLASWGFIVVGNEHPSTGFGVSTDDTLEFLLAQNSDESSVFGGKVDVGNIGLEGHSQGGAGCYVELSVSNYKDYFKTAVSLSPTDEEMANALTWPVDATKITAPVLMIAGTNNDVITLEKMERYLSRMTGDKAMMRRTGADHGKMLYQADGYATAWLAWQLQGDATAAAAFTGSAPEMLSNPLYQDQKIEIE